MRKLDAPADDPGAVYALCISRVRPKALRVRLQKVLPDVQTAATAFKAAAIARKFHRLKSAEKVGSLVTTKEMSAVYDLRMARKGSSGRPVYDRLMAAAPHMRCPLCGQRTVSTLDHYMPKAGFPALAVVPLNLIPACADCNKAKLALVAASAAEQTLHPYFDAVDTDIWLLAEVIEGSPPALRYSVDPPITWPEVTRERIRHHFSIFRLGSLYASHSGEELLNIRHFVCHLFEKAGADGVRYHLLSEVESRVKLHINAWQTAMYRALASSEWYCSGGCCE